MDTRGLVPGDFYRHFKNKIYQIKGIAYHSETKERMVVYQAMYGTFDMYVRPYDMFMSEVDRQKYPDVKQKYRFERVELPLATEEQQSDAKGAQTVVEAEHTAMVQEESVEMTDILQPVEEETEEFEELQLMDIGEEEQINPVLEQFLDAVTYQDKLNIIVGMKDKLNDGIITTMAISMDAKVDEGPLDVRYESLKNCITTHIKYESDRLR